MSTLNCKTLKLALKLVILKYWLNPMQCVLLSLDDEIIKLTKLNSK